jgi:hypothetical protein
VPLTGTLAVLLHRDTPAAAQRQRGTPAEQPVVRGSPCLQATGESRLLGNLGRRWRGRTV